VPLDRGELLDRLDRLYPEALLERLTYLLEMPPSDRPAKTLPHAARCAAVLEWVESPAGVGLERLDEALRKLVKGPSPPDDQTIRREEGEATAPPEIIPPVIEDQPRRGPPGGLLNTLYRLEERLKLGKSWGWGTRVAFTILVVGIVLAALLGWVGCVVVLVLLADPPRDIGLPQSWVPFLLFLGVGFLALFWLVVAWRSTLFLLTRPHRWKTAAIDKLLTRLQEVYPEWVAGWGGIDVVRSQRGLAKVIERLEAKVREHLESL